MPLPNMIDALNVIEEFDEEAMRAIWRWKERARIEEWRIRLEDRRLKRLQLLEYRLLSIWTNATTPGASIFGKKDA